MAKACPSPWWNMPTVRLYRVGHSIVMTVPRGIRQQLSLLVGDELLMSAQEGIILLTPLTAHRRPPSSDSQTDLRLRRGATEDEL
jgi:antitoxin component of MazEF toxin-antitoxin module